ncbi:MAG: hypothetical protein HOP03_09155 [Lysobacter sp.]|nr:hypothetical protein [Lysobacter sp.]
MSAPPPKKPKSAASPSGAAAVPAAPPALAALLQGEGRGIADFLSLDDGAALAQVSRAMHQAVQNVRGPAPTGRALVDAMPLYTQDAPAGDRFYHPTALSGAQAPFPHITRRADPVHVPHVTDVRPAPHAAMPDGLPAGNYPTRHRYDIGPDSRLAPPILPTSNAERRTATLSPFVGAPPDTYVMPRYKARAEALAAPLLPAVVAPHAGSAAGAAPLPPVAVAPRPAPLPALATPVRLTPSQRGDAPPGPPLTGARVQFQSKL